MKNHKSNPIDWTMSIKVSKDKPVAEEVSSQFKEARPF